MTDRQGGLYPRATGATERGFAERRCVSEAPCGCPSETGLGEGSGAGVRAGHVQPHPACPPSTSLTPAPHSDSEVHEDRSSAPLAFVTGCMGTFLASSPACG